MSSIHTSQAQKLKHLCATIKWKVLTLLIVISICGDLGSSNRDRSTPMSAISPPLGSQSAYLPSLAFLLGCYDPALQKMRDMKEVLNHPLMHTQYLLW